MQTPFQVLGKIGKYSLRDKTLSIRFSVILTGIHNYIIALLASMY